MKGANRLGCRTEGVADCAWTSPALVCRPTSTRQYAEPLRSKAATGLPFALIGVRGGGLASVSMEHNPAVRAYAMLHARLLVQEAMVRDFVSAAQHPP